MNTRLVFASVLCLLSPSDAFRVVSNPGSLEEEVTGPTQAELVNKTDDSTRRKKPIDLSLSFASCGGSSLAAIPDANSSPESLIHEDDDDESVSPTIVQGRVISTDAKVTYNGERLETSGTATFVLTINKSAGKSWKYKKTLTYAVYHVGAVSMYVNAGLNYDLQVSGKAGFQIKVPIQWKFCVDSSGLCAGVEYYVKADGIAITNSLNGGANGHAQASTSITFGGPGIYASAQIMTKATLANGKCTLGAEYNINSKLFKSVTYLLNMIQDAVDSVTGDCSSDFGELSMGKLNGRAKALGDCR